MSDDFGTVNVGRAERAREIEEQRRQYREHRDALGSLALKSPSPELTAEYQRLIRQIDLTVDRLEAMLGGSSSLGAPPAAPRVTENRAPIADATSPKTSAGNRPLVTIPPTPVDLAANDAARNGSTVVRTMLILFAGIVVVAAIVWMIVRASADRHANSATTTTATATEEHTTAGETTTANTATIPAAKPKPELNTLVVAPSMADYGQIRKGTRAVRQYEVSNNTSTKMQIHVERSACRCLYYDYVDSLPAKGKGTITVTIDGARAKEGALDETVEVRTTRGKPTATTTFHVIATIK